MRQKVGVYSYPRVALYEALGKAVDQQAKGMIHRLKTLHKKIIVV